MKVAVLGLGSIGRRHLGNLRTAGVETLTGYDAAPAQREAAAKDFPFATITATAEAAGEGVDGVRTGEQLLMGVLELVRLPTGAAHDERYRDRYADEGQREAGVERPFLQFPLAGDEQVAAFDAENEPDRRVGPARRGKGSDQNGKQKVDRPER